MNQLLRRLTPYVFLAPALVVLFFSLIYPMGYTLVASFFDWRMGEAFAKAKFSGLDNYIWLLNDENFYESFRVTITFAFSVVSLELIIGLGLALVLDQKMRGVSVLRTLFILPMMISPIVVGLVWRYMYNPQFGVLNQFLAFLGLGSVPWLSSPHWALFSVILSDVWQWTPFIFILSIAGLQTIPKSLIDAAKVDGATAWQQVYLIKIPLMIPILVVAGLLRLIDAFKVLEVIYILTNGGPGLSTEILSLQIYKTAFISYELGRAAALSNLLLFLVFFVALAVIIFTKYREWVAKRDQYSRIAQN